MNDQRSAQPQIGDNLAWASLFVAVVSALVVLARYPRDRGLLRSLRLPDTRDRNPRILDD